jgi:hypothetical protein
MRIHPSAYRFVVVRGMQRRDLTKRTFDEVKAKALQLLTHHNVITVCPESPCLVLFPALEE